LEKLQTPVWDRTRVCLNHSTAFGSFTYTQTSFTYKQTKQLADESSAVLGHVSGLQSDVIMFDVSSDVMCLCKWLAIRNDLLHWLCTSHLGFQGTRTEFAKRQRHNSLSIAICSPPPPIHQLPQSRSQLNSANLCNKTNLMLHCLSSVYYVNQPIHDSGISIAHHQEVYCIQGVTGGKDQTSGRCTLC